jgi:hypothetical protein
VSEDAGQNSEEVNDQNIDPEGDPRGKSSGILNLRV